MKADITCSKRSASEPKTKNSSSLRGELKKIMLKSAWPILIEIIFLARMSL